MAFLASNFGWFLIGSLVLFIVAAYLQIRNIRKMQGDFFSDFGKTADKFMNSTDPDPFKAMESLHRKNQNKLFAHAFPVFVVGILAVGLLGTGIIGLIANLAK
jgi:hypothetical protein